MIPAIGIGPLGAGEWSVHGVGTLSGTPGLQSGSSPTIADNGSSSGGSFSNALTSAIGSLESSQDTATTAAQQLATGQLTDPTQAITAVENASLTMNFAAQIRNQLDSAATTIFQTQA